MLRFEVRILDLMFEMSLDHQLQSAIIMVFVAKYRLLGVDLQQTFHFFRLFNLHVVQTVSKSVSDC